MTERGTRTGILAVGLATVLLALPFLGAPPLFDPDEGFYPAAAWESLSHGHPLDLTLNGAPRWNKPPLCYALMQGSLLLFGKSEFAVRLPSVLEAGLLVVLLGLVTARVAGGRAGLFAAAVAASCLGVQFYGRAAHPEMGLVLGTFAAEALLAWWFVAPEGGRPRWIPWAAGVAMGFGFLAKGPVAIALPGLVLVAGMLLVPRGGRPSWPRLGRAFGAAAVLAVALAAPWFLWMGARHGDAFWSTVFGQLSHYTSDEHEHSGNSPFYFVPVLVGGFLPWVALLPWSLRALCRRDPAPRERFRLLMALAAGTAFLFWSCSTSKLPNYGLVFFPPLAIVVGMWLDDVGNEGWARAKALLPAVAMWGVLGAAILAIPVLAPGLEERILQALAPPAQLRGDFRDLIAAAIYLAGVLPTGLLLLGALGGCLASRGLWIRQWRSFRRARRGRGIVRLHWKALRAPAYRERARLRSDREYRLLLAACDEGVGTGLFCALAISVVLLMPFELKATGVLSQPAAPFRLFAVRLQKDGPREAPLAVYRKRLPSLTFYTGKEVLWLDTGEELNTYLAGPGPRWVFIHDRHADLMDDFAPGGTTSYHLGGPWTLYLKEP